ncbi:hypothetical protein BGZ70_008493 [Mortierella alpina]|uniref:Uncharacterized protein n=1 Tax=Mortierella alpina TaxID=64518 RepID=A0A9P6J3F1_MORAP|nr:hypothetical protein BGZ70_008493 [Mortierella alpina]
MRNVLLVSFILAIGASALGPDIIDDGRNGWIIPRDTTLYPCTLNSRWCEDAGHGKCMRHELAKQIRACGSGNGDKACAGFCSGSDRGRGYIYGDYPDWWTR